VSIESAAARIARIKLCAAASAEDGDTAVCVGSRRRSGVGCRVRARAAADFAQGTDVTDRPRRGAVAVCGLDASTQWRNGYSSSQRCPS
jgi:hypothetical protein